MDPDTSTHTVPSTSAPRARPWYHWRRWGFNFLTLSILAHVFLVVGAGYLIVQNVTTRPKPTAFTGQASAPSAPTRALEHQVQMQKKQATMSAPATAKRIVTISNTQVALPAMPPVYSASSAVVPIAVAGMGGSGLGLGFGSGTGNKAGGGGMNFFGLHNGQGLAGTFYDLKQSRDGKPNEMTLQPDEQGEAFTLDAPVNLAYDRAVGAMVAGGMSEGAFGRFFRGPQTLYTTQIFIPEIPADEAPNMFNLEGKVKGRRWVVVYRGTVTPPEGGRYRFAGFGDDILVVRLDGQIVLDGSFAPPTKPAQRETYALSNMTYGWKAFVGKHVELSGGKSYPMEIAIGERPGGEAGAFLLLEKEGVQYDKEPSGAPILPIFKLARSQTPAQGKNTPPVAADTSWSVWRGQPAKSSGF